MRLSLGWALAVAASAICIACSSSNGAGDQPGQAANWLRSHGFLVPNSAITNPPERATLPAPPPKEQLEFTGLNDLVLDPNTSPADKQSALASACTYVFGTPAQVAAALEIELAGSLDAGQMGPSVDGPYSVVICGYPLGSDPSNTTREISLELWGDGNNYAGGAPAFAYAYAESDSVHASAVADAPDRSGLASREIVTTFLRKRLEYVALASESGSGGS
jgi:hypothetical protein